MNHVMCTFELPWLFMEKMEVLFNLNFEVNVKLQTKTKVYSFILKLILFSSYL